VTKNSQINFSNLSEKHPTLGFMKGFGWTIRNKGELSRGVGGKADIGVC